MLDFGGRIRLGHALTTLETTIRKAAVAGSTAVFDSHFYQRVGGVRKGRGSAGRDDALRALEQEWDALLSGLLPYAETRVDPTFAERLFRAIPERATPAGHAARPFGIAVAQALQSQPRLLTSFADRLSGGAYFSTLAASRVLGRSAADIDWFEVRLTPELATEAFASQSAMDEARAMYELWFRIVRFGIATAIARGLPYAEFWRVYGDGGYRLSELAGDLGPALASSRAFSDIQAARTAHPWIDAHVSFGDVASRAVAYPLGRAVRTLASGAAAWREHCAVHHCPASEQGIEHPYEFKPIPPDVHRNRAFQETAPPELHRNRAFQATAPDHMHARPAAQERIVRVDLHWRWLVSHVLGRPESALAFRITAGSLLHGGGHPPHTSHRNGAMFDVGIGAPDEFLFPSCTKIAISVSEHVIRRESEAERARDHPPKGPLDQLVDALRQLVTEIHEPEDTPDLPMKEIARVCTGDFEFPPGPYAMIALRFVQAILVTFPSQILYARWATLRDAQRDLRSRAIAAQKALDRNDDRGAAALAHLLRALPDPPDDRPSTRLGALVPRDDHHDHWHVSYRPEDVEAPDAARVEAIAWIEENRDRLWPP